PGPDRARSSASLEGSPGRWRHSVPAWGPTKDPRPRRAWWWPPRPRVGFRAKLLAFGPGVLGGGLRVAGLKLLLIHFLVDDGMPGALALSTRHVMFPRPAPQTQLFDEVQLRQYATRHDTFPRL